MKIRSIAKIMAAVAVCGLLLWLLQCLLVPKYMGDNRDGALISEYYDFAGSNDVVFIGDCEVYENFSPITLWEEYGIPSAIRGSPQQMIWQSYYLMEETFKYDTPDVIVFNVLSMKYPTPLSTGDVSRREAYNRMTLDGMRWSMSKWNAIQASMTPEEREWESHWTYLFPLLRYHQRWSELTGDDFTYMFHRDQVSDNGYLMQTGVKPVTGQYVEKPLIDYTLAPESWYWLDKMTQLCKDKGVQLVLIKAPTLYPIWWPQWDQQVEDYAKENGLLYVNLLEDVDSIGIDWNTDTYDAGLHLNVYGAEKLSHFFGQILKENCSLEDRRSDSTLSALWSEKIAAYQARKALLEAAQ